MFSEKTKKLRDASASLFYSQNKRMRGGEV